MNQQRSFRSYIISGVLLVPLIGIIGTVAYYGYVIYSLRQVQSKMPVGGAVQITAALRTTEAKLKLAASFSRQSSAHPWLERSIHIPADPRSYLEPPKPISMPLLGSITGPTSPVRTLSISDSGRLLAGGLADGTVILWDVEQQSEIGRVKAGDEAILQVQFTANLGHLAWSTASRVYYCPLEDGAAAQDLSLREGAVVQIGAAREGEMLFVFARRPADQWLSLIQYDVTAKKVQSVITAIENKDAWYPLETGAKHFIAYGGGSPRVADYADLQLRPVKGKYDPSPVTSLAMRRRDLLVVGHANGEMEATFFQGEMQTIEGKVTRLRSWTSKIVPPTCIAAIYDATSQPLTYIYGGGDRLEIWDLEGGLSLGECGRPPSQTPPVVALSPVSSMAFTVNAKNGIDIYELPKPQFPPDYAGLHIAAGVMQRVAERDWEQLDRLYDECRGDLFRRVNNGSLLSNYWDGVIGASGQSVDDLVERAKVLEEYAEARPQSIVPQIALAEVLFMLGSRARGGAAAANVRAEQWEGMAKFHGLAQQHLQAAMKLGDDPQIWTTALGLITSNSAEREVFEEILARHVKLDPSYPSFCQRLALFLLPRWHGEPGDVGRLAGRMADRAPEELVGDQIYVLMAGTVMHFERGVPLADSGFEYERLRTSAKRLMKAFPHWALIPNRLAEAAVREKDRALIKSLMQQKLHQIQARFWSDESLYEQLQMLNELPLIDEPGRTNFAIGLQPVTACAFDPEGKVLYVADQHGVITAIDPATREVARRFAFGRYGINAIATHPDGWIVFAGGKEGLSGWAYLVNTETGQQEQLKGHGSPVVSAAFAPDGKHLATQERMGMLKVWKLKGTFPGETIRSIEHGGPLDFVPSGEQILTVHQADLQLFSMPDGQQRETIGSEAPVMQIYCLPDGQSYLTNPIGGVRLRAIDRNEPLAKLTLDRAMCLAASPDRKHVIVEYLIGEHDYEIARLDLDPLERRDALRAHDILVTALAISPDGKYIAAGDRLGSVVLWNTEEAEWRKPTK